TLSALPNRAQNGAGQARQEWKPTDCQTATSVAKKASKMRKERLLLSYTHLTDYELSTLAGRVLAAMTDNDNFPDPAPSLAELEPLVNTYRTRHEIASRRGSALEISQKNESRQLLLEAFKQLAFYI